MISPREPANLLFTPFFLAFSLFFVYLGTGWVDLYPKAVVIGGLMRRRREIQLSDLGSVAPGRYGLCFRRADGSSSVGGPEAIGATGGVPSLFGLKTRGDRIAEAIMRQAAEAARDART